MSLLFGSAGANTYPKSGQVAPALKMSIISHINRKGEKISDIFATLFHSILTCQFRVLSNSIDLPNFTVLPLSEGLF